MFVQEVRVSNIIKELKKNKISSYYFLDEIFIEYLLKYNSLSIFEDRSFIIRDNENILYCPITIEKKNGKKYLNFFGEPIFFIFLKNDYNIFASFTEKIKETFEKEKIDDINLVIEKFVTSQQVQQKNPNKKFAKKVLNIKYIDLNLSIEDIKKTFKKGLKHVLNKEYSSLSYLIINKENYNEEIFKMKNMHLEISKKTTRSDETWMINEKMILSNKGFLVQVNDEKKVISYSLFFNNGQEATYFSSCTFREYFKLYKNITHNSIFEAIKYLKKIECKKLTLGTTKIIYSDQAISNKEENIHTFKSSFGGEIFTHYYLDKNNLDFIDLFLK
jgi:hypothetical protein